MAEERKSLSHAILFLFARCVDRKSRGTDSKIEKTSETATSRSS